MVLIIHRVNALSALKTLPGEYGVEIDVRHDNRNGRLYLNHDPSEGGDSLEEYLRHFNHAFIVFNIKEAGIEQQVLDLVKKFNIVNYFLLDVEPYYIYHATKKGIRNIAVRFSENEPLESALVYKDKVDWLWIDVPTSLPITPENSRMVQNFKTCLVCPERWGRPEEITNYIQTLRRLNFPLTAVMTSLQHASEWKQALQANTQIL